MKKIIRGIIIAAVWISVWEIIYLIVGRDIIVASPFHVFLRIIELAVTGPFWGSVGSSILRIFIGFIAALVAGSLIGILTSRIHILDEFFSPIASIIRATPVASFIILLFVFVTKNHIPAVTSFLMVLPATWANVYEGMKKTDKKLLQMAEVFELRVQTIITKIYFPQIRPYFLASVKTGSGLAWKAGIAAEVLINPKYGIGTMLYNSKVYLETTDLFAWTAVIVIISIVLEKIMIKFFLKTER